MVRSPQAGLLAREVGAKGGASADGLRLRHRGVERAVGGRRDAGGVHGEGAEGGGVRVVRHSADGTAAGRGGQSGETLKEKGPPAATTRAGYPAPEGGRGSRGMEPTRHAAHACV